MFHRIHDDTKQIITAKCEKFAIRYKIMLIKDNFHGIIYVETETRYVTGIQTEEL